MSFTEKMDVLDLLINILREHEEKLDELVTRLEAVCREKEEEIKPFIFKLRGNLRSPEEWRAYDILYELLKSHCEFKVEDKRHLETLDGYIFRLAIEVEGETYAEARDKLLTVVLSAKLDGEDTRLYCLENESFWNFGDSPPPTS